ncbi:MAG: aromatic ring-hydroxylating dioxygenase subunit alpha [Nannocystaceae bacterium]
MISKHAYPPLDLPGLTDDDLLARPLARAETLPAACYVDPRALAFERAAIFARSWQAVGHAAQVAERGRYFTATIAGAPVLVVRGDDGALRGFYNVCRHRAGPIALDPEGSASVLRCRYHGWTYGLDGALRGLPRWRGVECFDRAEYGLRPVAVHEWQGLVLVHLDPDAPPFADAVAGLDARLGGLDLGGLRFTRERIYEVEADWKVYVDNYLEGYHVPMVHPGLAALYAPSTYTSEVGGEWSLQWARLDPDDPTYSPGPGALAYYVYLFPNLMLNLVGGRLQTNLVEPTGPGRCRVIFRYFFPDPEAAGVDPDIAFCDRTQAEDAAICAHVQRGLASGGYTRGRLSVEEEAAVHHFQERLRRAYRGGAEST